MQILCWIKTLQITSKYIKINPWNMISQDKMKKIQIRYWNRIPQGKLKDMLILDWNTKKKNDFQLKFHHNISSRIIRLNLGYRYKNKDFKISFYT